MSLGERIKEQRKSSGLSQEKVAEFVGVSRQAVTKWETGQSAPSTENLFKLAEIFGTTVDILLASDEEEKDTPAEQIYYLYKMEQEKKREERRKKIKKNIFFTLVVAVGYVIVYLVGRIFGTTGQQTSVIATSIAPSMIGRYSSGQSFSLWPTRWRCSLSERSTSGLKYRSTGSPQVLISWITTGRLGIVPLFSMLARYRHSIPTISASALRARRRAFRAAFTSAPKVSKPGQSSTFAI